MFWEAKKSQKMKDANTQSILSIIDKGMLILGIKGNNLPSIQEKTLMINELVNHYINLTLGELDLAFTLAVRGQLDMQVETYQNFSVLYLNRLISSYTRWAAEYAFKQKPVEESKWQPREVLDEEKIETALDSYIKLKSWESIVFGLDVFKILYKRGDLSFDPQNVLNLTTEKMKAKLYTLEGNKRTEYAALFNDDDFMENQCRRFVVAQYFDKIMNK